MGVADLSAQALSARGGPQPNLESTIERPLRYRPDGQDFVIENGEEFFNRPLYGRTTAFRADGGDKPEFVLYLPGRGGNLRLGLRSGAGAGDVKWLHDAAQITTRYRPGSLLYEIRDPLLGRDVVLRLAVIAMHETDGLLVRAEATGALPAGLELLAAYGGVNGQRGTRDGDIGTERVPISQWFQLQPEFCRDNTFSIDANRFVLRSEPATIAGLMPAGAIVAVADASRWADASALLASAVGPDLASGPPRAPVEVEVARTQGPTLQVAIVRVPLTSTQPRFLALQRIAEGATTATELDTYRDVTADRPGADRHTPSQVTFAPPYRVDELPRVFAAAEAHFAALRDQIAVETPDPFLNAAVAALNVAADAVWDEPQGAVMHGAIAWRTRLLGWRGPYAMDALGWHDRARRHLGYWATRQNTDPIPEKLPPPDENANLARSEAALHSNGDMSNSHYDMNLVYIDALFRHLLWTGDLDFAREMWPVIARHLAWERRLFRREFTAASGEKLPLYEAYAAIWASDDLGYNGGGVTHASAYNHWHHTMAARLAKLLGHDSAPYETEAQLIARGMRELLWVREQGMFAEFKDLLGRQRVHPSAALWTFYHTLDSHVPTSVEAWQMTRYIDTQMPHLPVRGPGVPADENFHVLASTNWMPYSWSINNVVMGENIHTALGYWQAGRSEEAFRLTKSALLASMFMGICPGNVGSMNYLDVYRRESQRDFADGSGVTSRAIVEGLFGIKPDALAGELRLAPGWPSAWERASIRTPTVRLAFERDALTSRYTIESKLPGVTHARLRVPALRSELRGVTVNGAATPARLAADELGRHWLEVAWELASQNQLIVHWSGFPEMVSVDEIDAAANWRPLDSDVARGGSRGIPALPRRATGEFVNATYESVPLASRFNDRVTAIFERGKYRSPRSPFVSLALPAQGIGAWAGHVNAFAEIDDSGLRRIAGENNGRFVLPNGIPFVTPGPGDAPNILFTSMWDNYPDEATLPLSGRAHHVHLLMAGSTNWMQSRFDNGEVVVTYTDGATTTLTLRNPTNWWPIDQDYFIDDHQFRRPGPIPPRVNLKTGEVRVLDVEEFKGKGRAVPGGAATVLELPLDPTKELRSLTVRTLANEVVIGLMAATLAR